MLVPRMEAAGRAGATAPAERMSGLGTMMMIAPGGSAGAGAAGAVAAGQAGVSGVRGGGGTGQSAAAVSGGGGAMDAATSGIAGGMDPGQRLHGLEFSRPTASTAVSKAKRN